MNSLTSLLTGGSLGLPYTRLHQQDVTERQGHYRAIFARVILVYYWTTAVVLFFIRYFLPSLQHYLSQSEKIAREF